MSAWIKIEKSLETDPRVARVSRPRLPADRPRELAQRYGCYRGNVSLAECHWCGHKGLIKWPDYNLSPVFTLGLTIDHVLPLCRGGTHDLDNLVLACGFCNSSRSGKTVEEWLQS